MKTIVTRSTELIIEHGCGEVFCAIPSEELKTISKKTPFIVKCPRCKKNIKITSYEQ